MYNVEYAPTDDIYKAESGKGYWINLRGDINVNFGDYSNVRFNLLSNDTPVATAASATSVPYTWEIESGTVGITGFLSTVEGSQYRRIAFTPATSSYSKKLYLDDIVTRNYQSGNYDLSVKLSAEFNDNATIYLGIEEYDSSETSVTTSETAISPTGTPTTFTETFTSGSNYFVRPYIKVVETSAPTEKLKLFIREVNFSAEPGFATNSITHDAVQGWVLAGSLSTTSEITTDGSFVTDGIYEFRNGNYVPAFANNLRPGRGYWVYLNGSPTQFTIDES